MMSFTDWSTQLENEVMKPDFFFVLCAGSISAQNSSVSTDTTFANDLKAATTGSREGEALDCSGEFEAVCDCFFNVAILLLPNFSR